MSFTMPLLCGGDFALNMAEAFAGMLFFLRWKIVLVMA